MARFSGGALSLAAFVLLCVQIVAANEFIVGGKKGWALPTGYEPETFNQWAERLRFHVNDSLLFNYKAKEDSVLVVSPEAFQKCNTSNPVASYDDGHTVFKFPKSGPFYFISGAQGNCEKGQKLVVVVMSQGGRRSSSAASPAVSPAMAGHAFSPVGSLPIEGPNGSPFGTPAVAPTSGAVLTGFADSLSCFVLAGAAVLAVFAF